MDCISQRMLRDGMDLSIRVPIQASMTPPIIAIAAKTHSCLRKGARPNMSRTTSASSSRRCPRTRSGPEIKPLFVLSLMVTLIRGPGIAAPERAMTKEVAMMVRSVSTSLQTGGASGSS